MNPRNAFNSTSPFHTRKPLLRLIKDQSLCLESRIIGLVTLVWFWGFFCIFQGWGSDSNLLKSYLSLGAPFKLLKFPVILYRMHHRLRIDKTKLCIIVWNSKTEMVTTGSCSLYHINSDRLHFIKTKTVLMLRKAGRAIMTCLNVQVENEWRPSLHNITDTTLETEIEICSHMNKSLLL